MLRSRKWWFVVALGLVGLCLGGVASTASATFHLIKVREVFPGTAAAPDSDYVELQAYSPFQNQVQFGQLKVYNAAGMEVGSPFTPSGPLPNNANQMTVLIADTGFTAAFPGVAPDATDANLNLSPAAGAVCWPITELPIDCVSWGAFTGNPNLPSAAGSPLQGSGSGAIGDGEAILRSISGNCASALDDSDDTNNSAADFSEATPNPRPNSAAITETVCSAGGPTVTPNPVAPHKKKKCKKRKKASGGGTGNSGGGPAYAAKKKCKKKRK